MIAIFMAFSFETYAGPTISVNIVLGKDPAKDCPGFGFCIISATLDWENSATAQIKNTDNGNFTVKISEAEIVNNAPDKLQYFKNKKFVTFEKAAVIPADIAQAIGFTGEIVINTGNYKVEKVGGDYVITLPVRYR